MRKSISDEKLLVGRWSFGPPNNPFPYEYVFTFYNTNGLPDLALPFDSGTLTNLLGYAGQNSPTPSQKLFDFHEVVEFDGVFYDPSYGLTYSNAAQLESMVIEGFARNALLQPTNSFRMEVRPRSSNLGIIIQ